MAIPTQEMITEWRLDMSGNAKEIQNHIKDMRKAERAEKALDHMTKRLSGDIDSMGRKVKTTTNNIKGMSSTVGGSVSKFAAATVGILAFARGMTGVITTALDYEDWIGKNTAALDGMRKATAGIISDLDLERARVRLTTGDLQLNEFQLQAVTKAAVHMTRVMKTDFDSSLKKVTDTIQKGTSRGIKELGINVDLLGKATVKTDTAVALITQRFGGMTVDAENTNERISQLTSTFSNIVGQIGTAILQSDLFIAVMKKMVVAAKFYLSLWRSDTTSEILGQTNEKIKAVRKELSFLATDDARKYRDITGQVSNQIVLTEEQVASRRGALQKKLTTLVSQQEGMRLAVAKASLKEQISLAKNAQVVKTKIAISKVPPNAAKKKEKIVAPPPSIGFQIDEMFSFLTNEAVASSAKIAANVKAAMDAAKAVPISNIPLARLFDEEMFAKLQRGNAEFASIKMKMDAMAATGDVASASYQKLAAQLNKVGLATISAANQVTEFRTNVNDTTSDIVDMAVGAFASFASSLWSAADAAIQSGDSISAAIAKALKASLLALAAESTSKAIFALAEYALSGFTDASKLAAAGMYAAVAVAAGAAGLGMSAATASSSGSTTAKKNTTTGTQQFGQTVEDKRPVNINVFFNDPYDPSSAFVRSRSISTAIGRSQTAAA